MSIFCTSTLRKTAITTLAVLLFSGLASAQQMAVIEPNCEKAEGAPFEFCSGKDFGSESLSKVAVPKAWTETEKKKFLQRLLPLVHSKRLNGFFDRIEANGFTRLYRYQYGFNQQNGRPIRVTTAMMMANSAAKMIIVTDRYINYTLKDPIGSFDRADLTMLHELAHAFDGPFTFSSSEDFIRLTGFVQTQSGWELPGTASLRAPFIKFQEMLANNDLENAFRLSRTTSAAIGLSSFAVLANPQEYFAETAATIYFDPNSRTYLKPEVVTWFTNHVLN